MYKKPNVPIDEWVPPDVIGKNLDEGYKAMAEDEEREREALEWRVFFKNKYKSLCIRIRVFQVLWTRGFQNHRHKYYRYRNSN